MADSIQAGSAVEVDGVNDQRVALPMAHGVAEPGRNPCAMWTAVDRRHGEPRILFEQEAQIRVALHDLHRLRGVDGAGHAEWEARAGVVAFRRVVRLPLDLSPRRERKIGDTLVIFSVFGEIRNVGLLPDSAEVDFAGGCPGRRSGRWPIFLLD